MSRLKFFFRWYDLWVGAYIDWPNRMLYVCPIFMLGVRIWFGREPEIPPDRPAQDGPLVYVPTDPQPSSNAWTQVPT